MLLEIVRTIGANKKTILLVIVVSGIVCLIGFEMLLAYSAVDSGTRGLKNMLSFSDNIIGGIGNISNADNTGTGLGRLSFNFNNYDQLVDSTKGLNYTSGYALFNATVIDILGNGDASIWKEMLN